jgi:heat shock protein HslJ
MKRVRGESGMKSTMIASAVLATLLLGGCQKEEPGLENSAWLVEEIAGAKMQAPVPTLEFRPEGRLGGKASCNNYGGAYKAEDGRIAVSNVFATKMACPATQMAQEQALLGALEGENAYAMTGGTLTIDGADGRRIVARRVAAGS